MKPRISAHNPDRVLVVYTTSDYIDWIRNSRPHRVLFLTDPAVRQSAEEPSPDRGEEILCVPEDFPAMRSAVHAHLEKWNLRLTGIACFDCEALETAARLAGAFGLPYPGLDAVRRSRDKYTSKRIWRQNGIPCPVTLPVKKYEDAVGFLDTVQGSAVLKPFSGSGSELVFRCRTPKECREAFGMIKNGLEAGKGGGMMKGFSSGQALMLAEEWMDGPEFSCDFILEKGRAGILRKTRKIKLESLPFGTVSGYALCPVTDKDASPLADLFLRAAVSLGIESGICMVDYIEKNGRPVLIEMTPRPGGDCLPFLLKEAGNLDMPGIAIDFAARIPLEASGGYSFKPLIGLRLHAPKGGILKRCGARALKNEKRVRQLHLIRKPGHVITMPPDDYDSWLLGHVILEPGADARPESQCARGTQLIEVEIE